MTVLRSYNVTTKSGVSVTPGTRERTERTPWREWKGRLEMSIWLRTSLLSIFTYWVEKERDREAGARGRRQCSEPNEGLWGLGVKVHEDLPEIRMLCRKRRAFIHVPTTWKDLNWQRLLIKQRLPRYTCNWAKKRGPGYLHRGLTRGVTSAHQGCGVAT